MMPALLEEGEPARHAGVGVGVRLAVGTAGANLWGRPRPARNPWRPSGRGLRWLGGHLGLLRGGGGWRAGERHAPFRRPVERGWRGGCGAGGCRGGARVEVM